jgi:hypothetical protein
MRNNVKLEVGADVVYPKAFELKVTSEKPVLPDGAEPLMGSWLFRMVGGSRTEIRESSI